MDVYAITDKGKVRQDNQDSFILAPGGEGSGGLIAAVCDGMGGARAGNIASDLAVKTFVADLSERLIRTKAKKPDYRLMMSKACDEANNMVFGYSCFDDVFTGMGTTLVAAYVSPAGVYVINVGDSRAYKLTKNRIEQITRDHSLVAEMVARGELTEELARVHPRKNVITRALGVDAKVQSDLFMPKLQKGDRLLLCSDGLTNMMQDDEILAVSRQHQDARGLAVALMDTALARGAKDNVTIAVITR